MTLSPLSPLFFPYDNPYSLVIIFAHIGIVVSDMTVPRIPLIHINEGFKAVTGYGKKKIGSNCNFLQVIRFRIRFRNRVRITVNRPTNVA
jgi:hypothetical protein